VVAPGTTIAGRYVVTAHLGSGGMGDVFEVQHTLLGKRFALKRLSGEGARDRAAVERFLREARAAAATGHPGVVDVVDLGFADDGQPYLVMEKLVGETLRRRLERGPLDEDRLKRVGRAVLGALVACHGAGIVHRDIKPENLFLCADGRVKVLDFGLSQTTQVDVRLTQSGAVLGTPLYMSPEQARGEDCDARSDLYAVGAVLYECATGRPPFVAPAYSVLVAMILEVKPNPAPLEGISEPVRALILRALEKKVGDRPADAAEMLAALGEGPDEADWQIPRRVTGNPAIADAATVMPKDTRPESGAPTMAAPTPATKPAVPVPAPKPRSLFLPVAFGSLIVALLLLWALWPDKRHDTTAKADTAVTWRDQFLLGNVQGATDDARKDVLKHPDDLDLAGRDLLLALCEDRTRAYERLKELDGKQVPPFTAAAMAATRAMQSGQPEIGVDALGSTQVTPDSVDDLLVRYSRAYLLRQADHFDRAKTELSAILDRWPAFLGAIDLMLEPLLFRDEIDEAQKRVDAFVANAPPGPAVDKLEIELMIGQRHYREALDRIEKMVAADPGRVDEIYQFRGDLRVVLGDVDGAINAYQPIEDRFKHDEYVAGALATAGRNPEARALLVAAMHDYPKDIKMSRLGKLMVDATLLALETHDADLASLAAAAVEGRDLDRLEATVQSARAFARGALAVLTGGTLDPTTFPLGAASPFYIDLLVHDRTDADALAIVRDATAVDHLHIGVVASHIYMGLWLERARLELVAGDANDALAWVDRILRPRHYDASRGMVAPRAYALDADILDKLGRRGEADAVRHEISQLQGTPR
jgi:tRNA A-37 threonylcarbamoyl transferase component Bud32/tetratricopeptide (TPR) repeat protein